MFAHAPWIRGFFAAVLVILPPALDADSVLRIEDGEITAGDENIEIPILLDTDTDVYGFQLSLSTDPSRIEMRSIDLQDGAAQTADFSDGFVLGAGGGLSWGVVLDVTDPIDQDSFIPAGDGHRLAWIVADVVTDEAARTAVRFVDRAAAENVPATRNKVVREAGIEIPLRTDDAVITISVDQHPVFQRGNANQDGNFDLSDGVFTLNYLFTGGDEPLCLDAADATDNGVVDLSDAVLTFNNLFLGGPPPLPPHPDHGVDPTEDRLECENPQAP